ncbi:MAG: sugar transferase [Parachlamydiaceae bacterium]
MTADLFVTHEAIQVKRKFTKRLFDMLFTLFVVVLTSPLLLFCIAAIAITSKGPIIYGHQRIGRGGKPFKCYKFRTMYPDADHRLQALLDSDAVIKDEWEKNHKLKDDPRVTIIGRFLRKTSLDEFPQFWNVLRGDLSVVGPRPVVKAELLKFYGNNAATVLQVKPGLTGLWQVSGRSKTTYEKRVQLDLEYVQKSSFWFDALIVIKTIPALLFSKGAY